MFIGWIRKSNFLNDLDKLEKKSIAIDKNLIINTFNENQTFSFAIYEKDNLISLVSAFEFESYILINNFYYSENLTSDSKERILKLLLNNIQNCKKNILIMAKTTEVELFKSLKFEEYAKFQQVLYKNRAVAFNFTNSMAKSINSENYRETIEKLDKYVLKESRFDYISKILMKQSSLILSTKYAYQHSYSLNKNIIKISPFIVNTNNFSDAEKLLRGVIYYRGLKQLLTLIPKDEKEIVELYKSYKFDFLDEYKLMYIGEKPNFELDSIYGF